MRTRRTFRSRPRTPATGAPGRIALTFDTEHPDQGNCLPGSCDDILDHLRDSGVRATFFVQGRWALAYPDRARRIVDEGHLIANHSHFHVPATRLTPTALEADVAEAEETITQITGRNPRPWFRLPFFDGQSNAWVRATIQQMGYVAVGSNVDSGDWNAETTTAMLCDALVAGAREHDPAVATLHSWPAATAPGVRAAIEQLTVAGATFVTIADLSMAELATCDPSAPAVVNTTTR